MTWDNVESDPAFMKQDPEQVTQAFINAEVPAVYLACLGAEISR